jgi:hypothetical protein
MSSRLRESLPGILTRRPLLYAEVERDLSGTPGPLPSYVHVPVAFCDGGHMASLRLLPVGHHSSAGAPLQGKKSDSRHRKASKAGSTANIWGVR